MENVTLGRTVASYRFALEDEIRKWDGFSKVLRVEDKKAFLELMDACRLFASAASNAIRPILFDSMVMSILLFQQKKLRQLQKDIADFDKKILKNKKKEKVKFRLFPQSKK